MCKWPVTLNHSSSVTMYVKNPLRLHRYGNKHLNCQVKTRRFSCHKGQIFRTWRKVSLASSFETQHIYSRYIGLSTWLECPAKPNKAWLLKPSTGTGNFAWCPLPPPCIYVWVLIRLVPAARLPVVASYWMQLIHSTPGKRFINIKPRSAGTGLCHLTSFWVISVSSGVILTNFVTQSDLLNTTDDDLYGCNSLRALNVKYLSWKLQNLKNN